MSVRGYDKDESASRCVKRDLPKNLLALAVSRTICRTSTLQGRLENAYAQTAASKQDDTNLLRNLSLRIGPFCLFPWIDSSIAMKAISRAIRT